MAKFCHACGNALVEGSQFCNKCGAKVMNAQQPVQQQPVQQPVYQQPVQQPVYRQPIYQQPQPKQSSNGALIVCLTMLGVAMIIAGAFIIPGRIKEAKRPDFPASDEILNEEIDWEPVNESEVMQELVDAGFSVNEGDISVNTDTGVSETVYVESPYSTYDRPTYEEFNWYLSDVKFNGVPVDADVLEEAAEREGGWKALIIMYPQESLDKQEYYLLNVSVENIDTIYANIWFDWYLYFMHNSEYYDQTDIEDTCFECMNYGFGYYAQSPMFLDFPVFYEYGGTQYAVGSLLTVDGDSCDVVMMR